MLHLIPILHELVPIKLGVMECIRVETIHKVMKGAQPCRYTCLNFHRIFRGDVEDAPLVL